MTVICTEKLMTKGEGGEFASPLSLVPCPGSIKSVNFVPFSPMVSRVRPFFVRPLQCCPRRAFLSPRVTTRALRCRDKMTQLSEFARLGPRIIRKCTHNTRVDSLTHARTMHNSLSRAVTDDQRAGIMCAFVRLPLCVRV